MTLLVTIINGETVISLRGMYNAFDVIMCQRDITKYALTYLNKEYKSCELNQYFVLKYV